MALWTIVFRFRKKDYAYQMEGGSVMEALKAWIDELDTRRIADFGQPARSSLTRALERTGPNAVPETESVWYWNGIVCGFRAAIYIVETVGTGSRAKKQPKQD